MAETGHFSVPLLSDTSAGRTFPLSMAVHLQRGVNLGSTRGCKLHKVALTRGRCSDAGLHCFAAVSVKGRHSWWKQRGCRERLMTVWGRCPSGRVVKAPVTRRLVALLISWERLTWLFVTVAVCAHGGLRLVSVRSSGT